MTYGHFTELNCWKACREVVRWVWTISEKFPPEEKYDLRSNIIRASRSMTRNIAEGFGRYYHKENIKFCRTSLASQFEVEDDVITAKECAYISQSDFDHGISLLHSSKRLTNGYIRYLRTLAERSD